MGIVIGWIIFSCIAGAIARNKGNSFAGAFFVSILLSPLIGILIALVQKPNNAAIEKEQLGSGTMKKCPYCAEIVKREATVCKHCGRSIEEIQCPSCHSQLLRPEGPVGAVASCCKCGEEFTLP